MASEDHVKLIRAGSLVWNEWRHRHPDVLPQLDGADLRETNLSDVDLSGASLFEADLTRCNLTGCTFARANLTAAELENAELRSSNLQGARLIRANLRLASLKGADLRQADLRGADLREADLEGAELGETVLVDTAMEDVKGLNLCQFWAPVAVDHRTLIKTPKMPMTFLRHCGVPEELIELLPSVFRDPIQSYAVFISASHEDREFSQRLNSDLQTRGIRSWAIPEELRQQSSFRHSIPLHEHITLVVLSKHSANWPWLPRLVNTCLREERIRNAKLLAFVRADESSVKVKAVAEALKTRPMVDFRLWKFPKGYAQASDQLFQVLRENYSCGPMPQA